MSRLGTLRFARLHGVAAQQPRRVLVLAELGDIERRLALVVLGVREEKRAGEVLFVSSWTAAYLLPSVVIVAQSVQTSEFICPRAAGERGQARA